MIQDNVKRILEDIRETAIKAGRNPEDITLVGVTKTVTAKEAQELMDAGVCTLGENRVQSLLDKYEVLKDAPTWHLIKIYCRQGFDDSLGGQLKAGRGNRQTV